MSLSRLFCWLLIFPINCCVAQQVVSHRFLCTDYKGDRVVIVSAKGDIEWEHPAKTPQDCWVMPNGNVLFSQISGAVEVTMNHQIAWEYKAPPTAQVHSCQPLPDGNVLVGEGVTSRLVVVNRAGEVVKEMPIASTPKLLNHQMRGARRTRDGHYWVCLFDEMKVLELDFSGTLLRSLPFDGHPLETVKLPNNHLLITLWDKSRVIELDESMRTVWEITENELPGHSLKLPVGIQRLQNGNTLVGNYQGHLGRSFEGDQAMVFEVTPDKKVVWKFADSLRFRTVCQIQVLDVPADVTKGEVLR